MLSTRDAFEAYLQRQRAKTAAQKQAIGDITQGGILRHASAERWAFILPDVVELGYWRIQYFDLRGFSGHAVFPSSDTAIDAAIPAGFRIRDDGALDRAQTLSSFWRGTFAADLIRRINLRQITHSEGDQLLMEYDAQHAQSEN